MELLTALQRFLKEDEWANALVKRDAVQKTGNSIQAEGLRADLERYTGAYLKLQVPKQPASLHLGGTQEEDAAYAGSVLQSEK